MICINLLMLKLTDSVILTDPVNLFFGTFRTPKLTESVKAHIWNAPRGPTLRAFWAFGQDTPTDKKIPMGILGILALFRGITNQ